LNCKNPVPEEISFRFLTPFTAISREKAIRKFVRIHHGRNAQVVTNHGVLWGNLGRIKGKKLLVGEEEIDLVKIKKITITQ